MAEPEGIMATASLEGASNSKVQESRDRSVDTAPPSPPILPESPGFNDGHKQKAQKQLKFRHRRAAKSSTDPPTSTTARTGTPHSKPKSLPKPSQSQPSGSKDSASPPKSPKPFWMMHVKPEQFQDDPLISSMTYTPSDLYLKRVLKSNNLKIAEMLIERERIRPLELMKRAIELETRRRMGIQYSDPVIREDKTLAWPMIEYKKRRLDQEAKPMLFFDISRKPTDPAYKPFYLAFEGGEELPAEVLEEYLQLPLSPIFPLQMIRIRCEHEVLINWDVIVEVQREDDQLRVIDVFEAIYNTYNTPLDSQERRRHRDLVDSDIVDAAFIRRSRYIRADFGRTILRGMCRVDLLGNTTLFNGLFFDETFKQYCLTLREQDPNDIRLSPLF